MDFAYLRVSTKDKQDFERQIHILKSNGYNIDERNIFMDKVSGEDISNREQYLILKKIVRQEDRIIFTELSRFSRNYDQIAQEMMFFKQLNVKLIFIDMPFLSDSDDLTQKLISDICIKIFSYVAEQERINISTRIKQKLSAMKESGVKLGRPQLILSAEQTAILKQYINQYPEKLKAAEAAGKMGININSFYKQLRIYRQKSSQK